MEKLMLIRKLNNKSGKSIFMALFLLLVCVVVSVVIVTVAITSVMHVDSNKISNQEYLACSSAAELIKDSVAGSEYAYTYSQYKYKPSSGTVETYGSEFTSNETTAKGMKMFVTDVSEIIRQMDNGIDTSTNPHTWKFTVTQDEMCTVNVESKLLYDATKKDEYRYEIRFKLEAQDTKNKDSHGYRMSMVIPIKIATGDEAESLTGNEKKGIKCQTGAHTTGSFFYKKTATHDFPQYDTITTVTWRSAGKDSAIKITKGWDAYEK